MTEQSADITYLISPTEPAPLKALGTVSSAVEKKGCDALIILPTLRVGIQRKTWIDLVISLDDGRLANSIPKMDMAVRIIIIEGRSPDFDRTGHMVVRSTSKRAVRGIVTLRHTRESLAGVMFSLRYNSGLDVIRTDSMADTCMVVKRLGIYLAKSKHRGISGDRSHSTALRSPWGGLSPEERKLASQINFLQGMGIGQKTAANIITANGGKIPLKWLIGRYEMLKIPLIGEGIADRLLGFFDEA